MMRSDDHVWTVLAVFTWVMLAALAGFTLSSCATGYSEQEMKAAVTYSFYKGFDTAQKACGKGDSQAWYQMGVDTCQAGKKLDEIEKKEGRQ